MKINTAYINKNGLVYHTDTFTSPPRIVEAAFTEQEARQVQIRRDDGTIAVYTREDD